MGTPGKVCCCINGPLLIELHNMELPPIDLSWFAENLTDTVQEILDAWNDSNASVSSKEEAPPELLKEALKQLIEVLRIQEWNNNPSQGNGNGAPGEVDISELGDYGLNMLAELSRLSIDLGLEEQMERLEQLALSLGLWVARQNGELSSVELVVNGIARIANQSQEQIELERLFHVMGEILDAAPPVDSSKYAFENSHEQSASSSASQQGNSSHQNPFTTADGNGICGCSGSTARCCSGIFQRRNGADKSTGIPRGSA